MTAGAITGAATIDDADAAAPSDDARGPIRAGLAIMFAFFVVLGGWMAFAPLHSAVVGTGIVTVEAYRQTIQHLDGGIVRAILVRDGAQVRQGDVLMRLDETQPRAQADVLIGQYRSLRLQEARLTAERDEAARLSFPADALLNADDPAVRAQMEAQRNLFESRRSNIANQLGILNQRLEQLRQQIRGVQSQLVSINDQIRLIEQEATGTRQLHRQGYAPLTRVLALERTLAELRGRRGELVAAESRADQAIGEVELQIVQVRRERNVEVNDRLREVQSNLIEVEPRMHAAREALERLDLRAPMAGIVVGLNVFTVGAVIRPGDRVLDIVPEDSPRLVEAQIDPRDVDNIEVGMEAQIQLTGMHTVGITPIIAGQVSHVAADRMVDQRTGMPFFRILVRTDGTSRTDERRYPLLPGSPVEVVVPTRARTLLSYFAEPLLAATRRAFREH